MVSRWVLGWSGIYTNFPAPGGSRITWALPPRNTTLRDAYATLHDMELPNLEQYRYAFHWPGDEPALVEPDMAQYPPGPNVVRGDDRTPWGSSRSPAITLVTMTEGVVAAEAAAIDVPVLSACGERDLVPDPWAEPTAYRRSNDVAIFVVPRMAHMHNFASTRELLWALPGAVRRVGHQPLRGTLTGAATRGPLPDVVMDHFGDRTSGHRPERTRRPPSGMVTPTKRSSGICKISRTASSARV